jgi:hypothetical protein
MSDQTTIATILRAISSTRNRIGPHATADYALGLLAEDLKEAQTPAHLKADGGHEARRTQELGPAPDTAPPAGMDPAPAGVAENGAVFGHYRLPLPLCVERLPTRARTLLVEFDEAVDGDDVRALWALLTARLPIPIPLESQAQATRMTNAGLEPDRFAPRPAAALDEAFRRASESIADYTELNAGSLALRECPNGGKCYTPAACAKRGHCGGRLVGGERLAKGIALMTETLTRCAGQFEHYAELHRAKGTEEGNAKADANLEMARECRVALGVEPAPDAG